MSGLRRDGIQLFTYTTTLVYFTYQLSYPVAAERAPPFSTTQPIPAIDFDKNSYVPYILWILPKYHTANSCQLGEAPIGLSSVRGPQEKMSFFQIASGPILSIPTHSNTCQYDPCKVLLKKNDPFLTYEPPKVSIFLALVTGLVTD